MAGDEQLWLIDHAPIMGGAELFLLKLAAHARGGVVVVCPPESELAQRCRSDAIALHPVAMPHFASIGAVGIPAAVVRLARVLREAPPGAGLVATSAWSQALLAAAAPLLPGRRIVHLLHEQDTAKRRSARFVLERVGTPVAVGANAVRTYATALRRDDVAQVNNVLADVELAAAARAPRRSAERCPASGPPIVGALGRLISDKGILELVDELAGCRDGWREALLAGPAQDPGYAARVAQRIADHGLQQRILLRGPTDSASFLDALDVLIVPSTGTEGQPTVVLEALARGLDVVVRAAVYSDDYRGLPVAAYRSAADLGAALAAAAGEPAGLDVVARRFGAEQALQGLLAAARAPAALRRR
ncbi:MAG TPA: glycosyltransferase [Solirubrobacteraceae bacterium]|jgi:glycosyltransferase involved in cell wall biosynthesis|nr:glycosyltransferase [Solirubrobacteraceae bacterium]